MMAKESPKNIPKNHDLVDIQIINPNILLDIRYATENNFTKRKIYNNAKCYLRQSVALKLDKIQKELEIKGLGLKIWDGYRPLSAQRLLWDIVKDEKYVADPNKGSKHNRGSAIDLTLVDKFGKELPMPTGFDDFTEKAHLSYKDLPKAIIANRDLLQNIMLKYGFIPQKYEWWHFDDQDWEKYPLLDIDFNDLT
jgi:D-alanyl-D-alanine dipeptidase